MLIFLTGHKGFIGSHLYKRLSKEHLVHTDIRVFDLYKWDCIIHLAATTTIDTKFDPMIFENNVIFAKKILSTPYRTIYASSCSAKHNTNPYAASKIYNEWLGEKHGNAIGLRFHNVYGPGNNKGIIWFLMNQLDGAKITIRGPELIRDYVFVNDVVETIINCITDRPKGVSIDMEYVREIKKCTSEGDIIESLKSAPIHVKEFDRHPISYCYKKIMDVGTGIGLQTMDVVNLYQRLSGKTFDISVIEAGDNEPKEMISSFPLPKALTLEEGLLKMINNKS